MEIDVVQLAQEIIAINSVSRWSNAEVSDFLEQKLRISGFEVERLSYTDENGEKKISLVGKKGEGKDGLGFFSHSDTVPGDEWAWDPFSPKVENGRLIGRGSCDMKGPLAATLAAGASIDASRLKNPLLIVITADEEVSGRGAKQVVTESVLFQTHGPKHGIIAEPTEMKPVYAHKGGASVVVTAYGRSAHTSTDQGISANFLIAPFLAEMAELVELFKTDPSFMNRDFDPPTNGFNMVLDDGGWRPNVTAGKTVCTISFRPMPNDRSHDVIAMITERAEKYSFEVQSYKGDPFYISPQAEIVQASLTATCRSKPQTVPFGTDAHTIKDHLDLVILGPGNIAQAHTIGEWIDIAQLRASVEAYQQIALSLCT